MNARWMAYNGRMNNPAITSMRTELRYMPLKVPFVTARGRSEQARSVVIRLSAEDNIHALGAVTPAQYVTGESIDDAIASLDAMTPSVVGTGLWDHHKAFARLRAGFPAAHAARAGVEIAVMDAFGQSIRQPLWRHWGARRASIQTDVTISINTVDEARAEAERAVNQGIRQIKIKVDGERFDTSIERVRAIREAAPGVPLLVDANQSFTPESAREFLRACASGGLTLHLFEQPVAARDVEGLARVAADSPFPVGADEAVITPDDCREVIAAGGVQVVNIKLMKSGISGALEIIRVCQEAGITLMLGSMVESGIGIGAAVHLACGTGAFAYHDLDAPLLLAGDITEGAFALEGDVLRPSEAPGLGARMLTDAPG